MSATSRGGEPYDLEAAIERYRNTPLKDIPDVFWEQLREDIRAEEGGGGQCGMVTEYRDDERAMGWYLTPEGTWADHYWFETEDGLLIDLTADQFEDSQLGSVARLEPGDSLRQRYNHHLPSGAISDTGEKGPADGMCPGLAQGRYPRSS